MNFSTVKLWLLCVVSLLLASAASAQISRGTITGRITDPTGAVVPGAKIVAVDVATGSSYRTVSTNDGQYTIPFLAPSTYRVTVNAAGFKNSVHEDVVVAANERVGVDTSLEIGQNTDTVTVMADSPLLETSSASNGQVLNSEDIENMPVNGRTPLILAQLAYGAIPTGNPQFNHPFDNSGPSSVALGGGASKKNELLMDGSPDGGADGTIAFSPPMDATDEIKVETFSTDAAYGHTAGGTVNQVTKSGTNIFHGSAYEFLQVSALNDTPYFTKAANQKKSVTRFNQYGGSIGGPIIIPKVFNGRDKAFVFFAFEGIQDNSPVPNSTTVPTDAEKGGDFSALLSVTNAGKPAPIIIYNPFSAVVSGGKIVRQPFSGNLIPKSMLDKVGLNLVSYYPEPNKPGSADGSGTGNYYYPGNNTDRFDSELGRIDVNITSRNKLSFGFRHNDRYHASNNLFNNIATGSILIQPNWGSSVDDVHTFSPKTVWENRANWTRNIESRPLAASFDFSQLGFPPSLVAASTQKGFPVTTGSAFANFGYSGGDYIPFDSFQIFSILSHTAGKHSLSGGVDLRLYKENTFRYGNSSGSYAFGLTGGQGWTNGPNDTSAAGSIGNDLASMLLGLPTGGTFDINSKQTTQAKYYALFIQDNYRIAPKLTLNLGLRYERDLPTTEAHNESVNAFDTSATSPINAAAQAAFSAHPVPGITFPSPLTGGVVFATSSNRNFYQTKADNFSPRIGFAWTPQQGMSVRGGMGIFNNSVGRQDPIATGYNQPTSLLASNNGFLTPAATLDNPFPTGLLHPVGNSLGLATNLGQSVSFFAPKILNDYAVRWDIDIQQELPSKILFEIGYVGEHGVHNGISRNLDYVPAQYLPVGQIRDTTTQSKLQAAVANPFAGLLPGTTLNGSTVQFQQLLLAYPQFTGVTRTSNPAGSTLFDELEVRVEKRMAYGVRFLANYSWSKRLESVSYLNPQDTAPEKRISSDDRPQHLVLSATWQLPFGNGRKLNPKVPVVTYLVSGWDLTSIYTYQPQGAPLSWGDVIYKGPTGSLNDLKVNPHAVNGAFDKTQFDTLSADQPLTGYHIRTLPTQVTRARADGINALDMSIIKNNRITERLRGQLRADFFNALNHPNFAAPNLTPTSGQFSQITSQANLPRTIQMGVRLVF